MDSSTLLKLLAGVRLFEEFGPGDIEDFRANATGATYEVGQDILAEGDTGRCMHIILAGKVEVYRKGGGKPVPLLRIAAGESFGEMSLLLPGSVGRTASVRALEPTTTLMIDRDRLARIPAVASKLYRNIARTLASRLKMATDVVVLQAQCGTALAPASTIGYHRKGHRLRSAGS